MGLNIYFFFFIHFIKSVIVVVLIIVVIMAGKPMCVIKPFYRRQYLIVVVNIA